MSKNMAATLEDILEEAEEAGAQPSAIAMNAKSYEAFLIERGANGEARFDSMWFRGYPVVIDDTLPDYEIYLEGAQDTEGWKH